MSGDRWVVRYPSGDWGVERSSRRMSSQLFPSLEEALAAARLEAASAGGGDIAVQAPDGGLCVSERVAVEQLPSRPQRQAQHAPQDAVAWTVFA